MKPGPLIVVLTLLLVVLLAIAVLPREFLSSDTPVVNVNDAPAAVSQQGSFGVDQSFALTFVQIALFVTFGLTTIFLVAFGANRTLYKRIGLFAAFVFGPILLVSSFFATTTSYVIAIVVSAGLIGVCALPALGVARAYLTDELYLLVTRIRDEIEHRTAAAREDLMAGAAYG